MIERDWHGCYNEGWKGEIVDEAFSHPAKFARGLIRQIYQHAMEQGWVKPGNTILDPFGGVGLGARDAIPRGLNWVGVELELRFVELGRQNITLWEFRNRGQRNHDNLPTPGKAILIQGDSRYLCQVLAEAGAVVSSPPFCDSDNRGASKMPDNYFVRASGEPFGERRSTRGTLDNPANLGNLPAGEFDAALGSPPYEGCHVTDKEAATLAANGNARAIPDGAKDGGKRYGSSRGQLGTESGETFWSASREIMTQVHSVLRPNAVAIWVLKAFVRDKKIVDFPTQWRQLGESCGFETIEIIRAWLVEKRGTQYTLDGGSEEKRIERKSFFRRLAEAKAQAAEFWELLEQSYKARFLRTAHNNLWRNYHYQIGEKPPRPTRSRIVGEAQMLAWVENGKPKMNIQTRIDFEIVLVQRKAL